jgi:uncharacterized protein involved in tolerance to divalent cations
MNLYAGTIIVTVLVAADDEEEAVDLTQQHAEDELVHCLDTARAERITSREGVPYSWRGCVVYHNGDDELEALDVLERGEG